MSALSTAVARPPSQQRMVGHPSNGQKISENSSCISQQSGYCGGMKTNMTAFEKWTVENKHTLRDLYAEFLKDTQCTYEQWAAGEVASYEQFLSEMWKNCKGSK
jgi:hypothetical protein